jgi:hypothetical protein
MVDSRTQILKEAEYQTGGTYKIGTYAGSCYTQDGCWNILVKSAHHKIMFLFPKLMVFKLRLPHVQKIYNPKTQETETRDVPPDSFSASEDVIIIDSLGMTQVGPYYYAVNMDEEGHVIDTKQYAYQDFIETSNQKQLIDIGRNMAIVADDWVRSNPLVQFVRKTDTGLAAD